MSFDIPYGLIADIQAVTRREANLSSYDPNGDLPVLPSLHDAAQLDPTSEYLACKHCHGCLLNGASSIICVYCGTYPEDRPDSVKFSSTVGYRWFLDSLHLDRTELVEVPNEQETEGAESVRKPKAATVISVSELLDLELKWTAPETITPVNDKVSEGLDFGDVDLSLSKNRNNIENDTGGSNEGDGWEADFQSVSVSETQDIQPAKGTTTTTFPSIPESSTMILSDQLDSVFGTDGKPKNSTLLLTSESIPRGSFFESDDFLDSNFAGVSNTSNQLANSSDNTASSLDDSWFDDNQWQIAATRKDVKAAGVGDASTDWNEFSSSDCNVLVRDGYDGQQASGLDFFDTVTTAQITKSSVFSQSGDHFLEGLEGRNFSASGSGNIPIPSTADSVTDPTKTLDWAFEDETFKPGDTINGNATPNNGDLETIMSQTHDLSFMLASQLSIPPRKNP